MQIEKIFNQYISDREDLEDLTVEELINVIQDPHAFKKKKKIVQQKPMKKVRTKRNRRK